MAAARVILVSDTHLSASAPQALTTGTPAQQELIEPAGLEQLTLTIDLPDPYYS